ncbi:MAG: hypothetical protein ACI9BD_001077, partial [Candidatus Marinamargulisbacteria bacterium]
KREELSNQRFFCLLLQSLGWPSYRSEHYELDSGGWEISEYLGPKSLDTIILENSDFQEDIVCRQLAYQAALGDVLGRGDRHFENYVLLEDALLPIDISFLFWSDNEKWIERYVNGGLYEINFIDWLLQDSDDLRRFDGFFFHYQKAALELVRKKDIIKANIDSFYQEKDNQVKQKKQFVGDRLSQIGDYVEAQKQLYLKCIKEFRRRQGLKQKLSDKVKQDPSLLTRDPDLKMYFLADQNRLSSFFLLEDRDGSIEKKISEL